MNINGIQTGQASQNVIKSSERSGSSGEPRTGSVSISGAAAGNSHQLSEAAVAACIDFLKNQLDTLLTSYPPFFPVGSYQRPDLIKGIQTLEEKIGKSAVDESIRKTFSGEKLPDDATDAEISVSVDRLFAVKEKLAQNKTAKSDSLEPGSFLDLKV